MMSLVQIYGLPIAASGVLAAGLAVIGAQVAARDRAMQTLCMTQGALLGVLLGIGMASIFHLADEFGVAIPFLGAVCGAVLVFGVSELFVRRIESSKNTYFAALFAVLVSGGHLLTASFPGLEAHMTQRYFGDLAMITDQTARVAIGSSLVIGVILLVFSRRLTKATFFESMLGVRTTGTHPTRRFFATLLMLAVIAFATQVVGLLFTITALFVPTAILSRMAGGYKSHLVACGIVGFFASILGFILSLVGPQLPTVPLVGMSMVIFAVFGMLLSQRALS